MNHIKTQTERESSLNELGNEFETRIGNLQEEVPGSV